MERKLYLLLRLVKDLEHLRISYLFQISVISRLGQFQVKQFRTNYMYNIFEKHAVFFVAGSKEQWALGE